MSESTKRIAKQRNEMFLKSLDFSDKGWNPIQDDKDGIESYSPNKIVAHRTARELTMRMMYSESLFSENEEETKDTKTSLAVATSENDINRRMKWGYTPLIAAAVAGDMDECKRLVAEGADKSIKDNSGNMAWQKAKTMGNEAIAIFLKV